MSNTPEDYEALVRDQLTQLGYDASAIPDDVRQSFSSPVLRSFPGLRPERGSTLALASVAMPGAAPVPARLRRQDWPGRAG
eukprot:scaffold3871_cov97-Isochrysis_galbana.AAC.12